MANKEGSWRSYKLLLSVVESAIVQKRPEAYYDLDGILKRFKSELLSPLRNPVKNASHRAQVQQAATVGISIGNNGEQQKFPSKFVDETLLLSDILNLNELVAVELLLVSEQQKANFPGQSRGLVAVLLYHDGRRCLLSAIRTLLQAREGLTWTLELDVEISDLIRSITKQMLDEELVTKLLDQLAKLNLRNELKKLQEGQAIGNEKHQRQLIDLLTEQRLLLAESIFCIACQSPLNKADNVKILKYLQTVRPDEETGEMDQADVILFFALIYALNVSSLESQLELPADHVADNLLPILQDAEFLPAIHQEVSDSEKWSWIQLCSAVQFAWGLTLRLCGQYAGELVVEVDILAEDDGIVTTAILNDAFEFFKKFIVGSRGFYEEEYFVRRLHLLITDFIVNMPLKVKELRTLGDEAARILQACAQEGVAPPVGQRQDFENFMNLISDLYKNDPLGLELAEDFWIPLDSEGYSSALGDRHQNAMPKQIVLCNFIRVAGDLLPANLFVPYLGMLTGLAGSKHSARRCFYLLKTNGLNAAGTVNAVSWDHFFDSLKRYYIDLRQENIGLHPGSYQVQFSPMSITAEEQIGLEAVLRLTATVAKMDETARIALCENPSWVPLTSMFGLLGCSIPTSLKACILETLAAFAMSQETTASMWQSLETSQILQTVKPAGQALQESGLLAELEEIESRNETYPETRAFMTLLANLTAYPVPANLGAGYRVPGFEPYLEFLRDSVLLKFKARAYLDPNEKWQVASGVLQIFVKLLEQFEPSAENMSEELIEISSRERITTAKTAGYTLMVHMLNETPMLKMVLSIVNEASELLEQITAFKGKKEDIEMSALLSLKLVEITMEKQQEFTNCLRQQNSSVLVTSLDQLLLGVGVRPHATDCVSQIARFITHTHTTPELALVAIKILYLVCQTSALQLEIYNRLTANKERAEELLVGFVDHLDTVQAEDDNSRRLYESTGLIEDIASVSQIRAAIRQNIVRFLLFCLKLRSPNLSQYMLGFNGRKPIVEQTLQDPGVLGTPRTCLHSVLDILGEGLDTPHGPAAVENTPRLAELCFKLVYALCQNLETSDACIRYLRTSHNFFQSHLVHLPFVLPEKSTNEVKENNLCKMNQQSWLLKTIATELRMTAQTRQRSHVQQLLSLLLVEPSDTYYQRFSGGTLSSFEDNGMSRSVLGSKGRKIMEFLDSIDFTHEVPAPLHSVLNYFEPAITEAVITSCDESSEDSPFLYTNLRRLYKRLMNELEVVQGPATEAQKNMLVQEVKRIMNYTLERNRYREGLYYKQQAFESWRQLVEVILASCPPEILNREVKQTMIFDLTRELLYKMSDENSASELVAPVSGVVLTFMAHLRQSTLPSGDALHAVPSHSAVVSGWHEDGVTEELAIPTEPLLGIFRSLIQVLIQTSGSHQRVRANLYGSLLYYLQIGQRNDNRRESIDMLLLKKNYEIISNFGEALMEIVCRDCCDGHDVTRMLSCAVVDSITSIDWRNRWLIFLNTKGYLRHLVESLLLEDENLQTALNPSPEPLKSLYVYESRMALLTRLAQSPEGAKVLLNTGVMSRLSECRFIDMRPSGSTSTFSDHRLRSYSADRMISAMTAYQDSFVPSIMERYLQLLIPALRMSLSLLTSLGQDHREASIQILHFIVSHAEVFADILQEHTDRITVSSLHELYLVSGIVCKAGVTENAILAEETRFEDMMKLKAPLSRIQRLMLALLPKYSVRENWDRIVREVLNLDVDEREAAFKALQYNVSALEAYQTLQQIYGNLITYCKNVVVSGGLSDCQVIFAPLLDDVYTRDIYAEKGSLGSITVNQQRLSIIVRNLKICCEKVANCVESYKQASHKLNNIDDLSMDELKELGSQYSSSVDRMSTQQKQQLAFKCLREVVKYRSDELDMYLYIIENSLFILCKHLEYYYVYCIPSDREVSTLHSSLTGRTRPRRLQDYRPYEELESTYGDSFKTKFQSRTSRADIEKLKSDASTCLTDAFLRKLRDIEKNHRQGPSRAGFVDALTRRIKRLLVLHGPQTVETY